MPRGIGGALVLTLFLTLFATAAAANPIEIHDPVTSDIKVYTEVYVPVNLSIEDGSDFNLTKYTVKDESGDTIKSKDISEDHSRLFEEGPKIGDGHNTLVVFASNGTETVTKTRNFTVDTTGPNIVSKRPEGDTFDMEPVLDIQYEDTVTGVNPESIIVEHNGESIVEQGTTTESKFNATLENLSEGDHNISFEVADNVGNEIKTGSQVVTWQFTLPEEPVLAYGGSTGLLEGTDASIDLRARDPSGVALTDSYVEVERNGNRVERVDFDELNVSDTTDVTLTRELTDLGDGEYTVSVHVEDNSSSGYVAAEEWAFTVDTTPPDVSVESHTDGEVVKGEHTFRVSASDGLSAVDRVRVQLGDEERTVDETVDGQYRADIDTADVGDGETTLTVTAYDAAGNGQDTAVDLVVDNSPPRIEDLSVYPETVAENGRVTAIVKDYATGTQQATYRIVDTNQSGSLVAQDGVFDDAVEEVYGTFSVTDLSAGRHELIVTAKDGAQHTSDEETATITVDPDVSANLSVVTPDEPMLTAGNETTVDVDVTNMGTAGDVVSVNVVSDLAVTVGADEKRINPGETRTFPLTISAADVSPGPYTATVTVNGLNDAQTAVHDVLVQPRPAEQDRIKARFNRLQRTFNELQSSKEEYDDAVDDEKTAETFETTAAMISEIESLLDDGRYYAASERLDETEQRVDTAETALTGMVSAYKRQQLVSTVMQVLAVLLFIGVAVGVYRMMPGEEGYHAGDGFTYHGSDDTHPVRQQFEQRLDRLRSEFGRRLPDLSDVAEEGDAMEDGDNTGQPTGWDGFDPHER